MVSRSFVLAAIGVLFASVSAQNLVLNGDFEALSIGNSVPGTPKVEEGGSLRTTVGLRPTATLVRAADSKATEALLSIPPLPRPSRAFKSAKHTQ